MSNPNLEEARLAAYRGLVLAAAEAEFAEKGEAGTLVKGIADRAGMSVGTVYKVFDSKPDIFTAVLVHRMPELMAAFTVAVGQETSAACRLFGGIAAWVEYLLEHPTWLRVHLREHPWGVAPGHEALQSVWRVPIEAYAGLIEEACLDGTLRSVDAETTSRCILALIQVLLDQELEHPTSIPRARARVLETLWAQFAEPSAERCF